MPGQNQILQVEAADEFRRAGGQVEKRRVFGIVLRRVAEAFDVQADITVTIRQEIDDRIPGAGVFGKTVDQQNGRTVTAAVIPRDAVDRPPLVSST